MGAVQGQASIPRVIAARYAEVCLDIGGVHVQLRLCLCLLAGCTFSTLRSQSCLSLSFLPSAINDCRDCPG